MTPFKKSFKGTFKDRVVLITGAASGIGRETAYAFAKHSTQLVLADLDEAGLAQTAARCRELGSQAATHCVDVASREQMASFAAKVHAEHSAVDVLFNNAGVGVAGDFLATDLDTWDWIIGVNLKGVIHGCHFFGQKMVERGRGGQIVNMSSTAGYAASRIFSAYSATKFGVIGLSESLRAEYGAQGIGVSVICPGIINTQITRNTRLMTDESESEQIREKVVESYEKRAYGPEKVAAAILAAVRHNRAIVPVSPEAWFAYYLKRFAPSLMRFIGSKLDLPR